MGDIYSLETPESVAVGYSVAGIGTRFMAAMIDTALQVGVLLALWIVTRVAGLTLDGAGAAAAVALGLLVINVVLLGYYIFFELVWNGQTPGKRANHIRVIKTSGYPVTPFAVLIRNVLRIVDVLPTLYAVGVITMAINRQSRRVGDLVAGTMVIKEGREGSLSSLSAPSVSAGTAPTSLGTSYTPAQPARPGWFGNPGIPAAPPHPAPQWPYPSVPFGNGAALNAASMLAGGAQVERLTREDEALVRDFLSRRTTLSSQRRAALAGQIAGVIHARIGGASPFSGDSRAVEPYLELVLAARNTNGTGM